MSRIDVARPVREMALSKTYAVFLGGRRAEPRLAFYSPVSGRARGTIAIPRTASSLSVSGSDVVFRTGNRIWLLDMRTRRRRVVARAARTPVGLSIEGRRIVWAEGFGKGGRVRVVFLRRT